VTIGGRKPGRYEDHHNEVVNRVLPRSALPYARRLAGVAPIALILVLAACNRAPEVRAAPKPPSVTVVAVAQRPVPVYGQYVGQTEAVKTVEVRARVEGFIERQVAPDGANVKAGDLLFTIDPRPLEAALRQAESNVARDTAALHQAEAVVTQREADVRQAQANLERDLAQVENARAQEGRYRTLLQKELIANEQYDQIRTNMTALEATVQADRAALENARAALAASRAAIENARAAVRADEAAADSARLQLGYTSIKSPLDGRMGRAEVRVGALVGKGDATLLATVSTLDPMYVSFSVSEREALSVWSRRLVEMQAKPDSSRITITLPDDTAYAYGGRLDFVDRAVDPRTGTLALRAAFPNPAGLLQPGQYVRLRILLAERPDALVVPQAAIQESQGSTSLFVIAPDKTVQVRTVRMGTRVGPLWVVEDGVKPGEHVVVKGLQQIRAGMRVESTVEPLPPTPGS
jgi:RND family efflux transporter MFP subunit